MEQLKEVEKPKPRATKVATRLFLRNIAEYTKAKSAAALSKSAASAADDALGGGFKPSTTWDAKALLASVSSHVSAADLRAVGTDDGVALVRAVVAAPRSNASRARASPSRPKRAQSTAFGSSLSSVGEKSTHKMGLERKRSKSPAAPTKQAAVLAVEKKKPAATFGKYAGMDEDEIAAAKARAKAEKDAKRKAACAKACAKLRGCAATVEDAAARVPALGPIASAIKAMAATTRRSFDAGEAVHGTAGRVATALKAALPMIVDVAETATVSERCARIDGERALADRQILGLAPGDPGAEEAEEEAAAGPTTAEKAARARRSDVRVMVQTACAHFVAAAMRAGHSLEDAFAAIDTDGDGELHPREFIAGARACGITDMNLSDDELQLIFRRLDRAGGATMLDGRLSLTEWGNAVRAAGGGEGVLLAVAADEAAAPGAAAPGAVLPPGQRRYAYRNKLAVSAQMAERHLDASALRGLEKRAALDDALRIALEDAKFVAKRWALRREGEAAAKEFDRGALPLAEQRAKFRRAADGVETTRAEQRAAYDRACGLADVAAAAAEEEAAALASEAAEAEEAIRIAAARLADVHTRAASLRGGACSASGSEASR